jgi:predicted enzyme related to lactoylglutathione lyase
VVRDGLQLHHRQRRDAGVRRPLHSLQSEGGALAVNISGARTGERLGSGDASPHHGLEHFGFDSQDIEADIARLTGLGAALLEGPTQIPNGARIAFLRGPDDTRLELVEPRKIAGGAGGCC